MTRVNRSCLKNGAWHTVRQFRRKLKKEKYAGIRNKSIERENQRVIKF